MKKMQITKGAETNIFKRKGFYIALGLCLVAIGIAVYIGVNSTISELNQDRTLDLPETSVAPVIDDTVSEPVEQVNNEKENVPVIEPTEEPADTEKTPENKETKETKAEPKNPSFALPLEGDISSEFSSGELVKSKTLNEWRTHDGIDLLAEANTPVKAASDGVIEEIREDSMWGVCIVLSHENDIQTMYYGLKPNVPVKKGAEVKVGDIIGYVGNTAEIEIAEESHLHFAMKQNEEWVNPMDFVK